MANETQEKKVENTEFNLVVFFEEEESDKIREDPDCDFCKESFYMH